MFLSILLFTIGVTNFVYCGTSSEIPPLLIDCYRNNFTITAQPPLTLPLFLELIRKIELNDTSLDIRAFTTTILHSVVFDGIRKSQVSSAFALPYRATGSEFYKYKLLVDYLTPGSNTRFPKDALMTEQLCFLHQLLSNTIDKWMRGDEIDTCKPKKNMPFIEIDESEISSCPIKRGAIQTRWGNVSPGHIIATVAAVLEPQTVSFQRLAEDMTNETKSQPISFDSKLVKSDLLASITGDLARLVLSKMTIGNSNINGFWNDSLLPRNYYLESDSTDVSDDQILGGIDALLISSTLKKYTEKLETTRLSQIIDMYYSERGAIDGTKASNRSELFYNLLDGVNLDAQVKETVLLLQKIGAPTEMTFSDVDMDRFSNKTAGMYRSFADKLIKTHNNAEGVNGKQMRSPIEVIVILDGTYDSYTAQQFLYTLFEALQVSYHGGSLGAINGENGQWIVPVTTEIYQMFTYFSQNENNWPNQLSLSKSLETVVEYYNNKTNECNNTYIKPTGKSLVLFGGDGRVVDNEATNSKSLISSIKGVSPETNILYITTDENKFYEDLANNVHENDVVINPNADVLSLVNTMSDKLSKVPADIINFFCNHSQVRLEDYITPDIETYYAIHREYIKRGIVTVKFSNGDYGQLQVCGTTSKSSPDNKKCEDLSTNQETQFNSNDFCSDDSTCDLYFIVNVKETNFKCAEYNCRYPDQIRLDITYKFNAGSTIFIHQTHLFLIVMFFYVSVKFV